MKNTADISNELTDYYDTAMFNGNPMAVVELSRFENADSTEIERLARQVCLGSNNNPFGF